MPEKIVHYLQAILIKENSFQKNVKTAVFVTKIPKELDTLNLRKGFAQFGNIISFKHLVKGGSFKTSVAYITYKNPEHTQKVIDMGCVEINGHLVHMKEAYDPKSSSQGGSTPNGMSSQGSKQPTPYEQLEQFVKRSEEIKSKIPSFLRRDTPSVQNNTKGGEKDLSGILSNQNFMQQQLTPPTTNLLLQKENILKRQMEIEN